MTAAMLSDSTEVLVKRIAILVALAVTASLATGCVVRTSRSSQGLHGKHAHQHCHERGGKHHKVVCHDHPHDGGHH